MEDHSKRAKWIAVLVLVVAGGLFGRQMVGQIVADNDRSVAMDTKEGATISTLGLYELHTHCAAVCREQGDLSGAAWHERILAHMRGEKVDESANLDDAGEVDVQQAAREAASAAGQSIEDPTHARHATAQADAGAELAH